MKKRLSSLNNKLKQTIESKETFYMNFDKPMQADDTPAFV